METDGKKTGSGTTTAGTSQPASQPASQCTDKQCDVSEMKDEGEGWEKTSRKNGHCRLYLSIRLPIAGQKRKRKEKERSVQPVKSTRDRPPYPSSEGEKKKYILQLLSSYVIYLLYNRCRVCVVEYAVCQPPNAIEKYLIRPFYFLSRSRRKKKEK